MGMLGQLRPGFPPGRDRQVFPLARQQIARKTAISTVAEIAEKIAEVVGDA